MGYVVAGSQDGRHFVLFCFALLFNYNIKKGVRMYPYVNNALIFGGSYILIV